MRGRSSWVVVSWFWGGFWFLFLVFWSLPMQVSAVKMTRLGGHSAERYCGQTSRERRATCGSSLTDPPLVSSKKTPRSWASLSHTTSYPGSRAHVGVKTHPALTGSLDIRPVYLREGCSFPEGA